MYSEQLEQLIKSVIADGAITDKERSVLHKKAAAEGIDEDEIDVYIDGLIVNSTKPTPQEPNNKRDMNFVEKVMGETILYKMKDQVRLNIKSKILSRLYVNLVYVEQHERTKDYPKGTIGILISGFMNKANEFRKVYSIRNLTIQTSHNSFSLKHDYYFEWGMGDFAVDGKKTAFSSLFRIDKEILLQLCNANSFSITIPEIRYYYDSARGENKAPTEQVDNAFAMQDFASYAQVFYRSTIDNSAFPDAEFQTKKAGDNMDEIARLLGANEKTLQAVPTDAPCYKQYRDITSNMTVIHVSDSKSLVGSHQENNYHLSLKMHAAKKEGEALAFYFELGSDIPYSTDDEGERTEDFPLGLDGGIISISVGAKAFKLLPVTYSKELLSSQISQKDYEHNFFAIDDEQIKLLMQAKEFVMTVSGSEGISIRINGMMSNSVSIPKKWVLAYNLLTNPADKERLLQEYHDSKISTKIIKGIKGLFGKK